MHVDGSVLFSDSDLLYSIICKCTGPVDGSHIRSYFNHCIQKSNPTSPAPFPPHPSTCPFLVCTRTPSSWSSPIPTPSSFWFISPFFVAPKSNHFLPLLSTFYFFNPRRCPHSAPLNYTSFSLQLLFTSSSLINPWLTLHTSLPTTLHPPIAPPSLSSCVPPLRRCSWTSAGRLQWGGDSCGGVCSAAPAVGGPHLRPEQDEEAALQQEEQQGCARQVGRKGMEGLCWQSYIHSCGNH